jgi:hypothetical protein
MTRMWIAWVTLCATAGLSRAEPYRHDGAFVRLEPGAGAALAGARTDVGDLALVGPAGSFRLSVGGAVMPGLIVAATASSSVVVGPDLELDGMRIPGDRDAEWGVHFLGGHVGYYVMPLNLYVGGSVGAMVMTWGTPSGESHTDVGFGGAVVLGKEWWLSGDWGLGVSAGVTAGLVPSEGSDTWGVLAPSVAVSATYN